MEHQLDILGIAAAAISSCKYSQANKYYFILMGGMLVCYPRELLPKKYEPGPCISGKEFRDGLTSKGWDKLEVQLRDYCDEKGVNIDD